MNFSLDKAINGTVVNRTCYYMNGVTIHYVFCPFMSLLYKSYTKKYFLKNVCLGVCERGCSPDLSSCPCHVDPS